MTEQTAITSQISITIDGQEVQADVMSALISATVDQHSHLPDLFTLTFFDSDMKLLDEGPFDLTKTVEISAEGPEGDAIDLIKGEITALEPNFEEGMIAHLVVRGYDKSHRLYRETKTKAYLNKKDSDLADEIAGSAGLRTEIETTSIVYDHIFQHNQTDLEFLQIRARRIGYECFLSADKLFFRKPPNDEPEVSLAWGSDLKTFHPSMTLAEQVDEVVVRGWDVQRKEAIVGRAQNGRVWQKVHQPKNGGEIASDFGFGKVVFADLPVVSQAEADVLAAARLDELSGAFIEAEGEAFRRPDIRAGRYVDLQGLGSRLSGKYLVTSATHSYSPEGLQTTFSMHGSRSGIISEQLGTAGLSERFPSVVTGIVTNAEDPNGWGRVKLKFPWMSDDAESDWARVSGQGAGPEAGLCVIPEVGDEVVVAFEHGDFSRPFVLGGLWNGQADLPPETARASSDEKPLVRTWRSRTGHRLTMHDDSQDKIEIETAGGHKVAIDDAGKKLAITTTGGLTVSLDDNASKITIESGNEIELKSTGNMKLDAGGNLDLKANGQVNVRGATVNLN